jgi:[lysine-biosynthesis-protein LysW]--L-2-aminoadipate ligase
MDVDAAVLVSRVRREEKQIFAALDRRGVSYAQVDVREMVATPDLTGERWRVALNREISHSRALHAGLAVGHMGRPLINSAAAVEVCGDKWRTALALHDAGLPTPRTVLALSPAAVPAAAGRLGYPVVIKPLTSSWGRRVVPVRDPETAATVAEFCAALPGPQSHIVCVQELIDKPDRDIRVIVVGGEPLGAIYRRSAGWRTNVALGGRAEPCPLTDEITKYAIGAAAACGADIAGVDLLEGPGGELYVLEVNHGVEFSGFTQALDVDVAGAIVDHLLTRIEQTERVEP